MGKKKKIIIATAVLIIAAIMALYAGQRAQNTQIATRTVTFLDGTKEVSKQKVEVGKGAEEPEAPKYKDLVFVGWYNEKNKKITDFSKILENMTLTAKYAADINNNGIADTDDTYYKVIFFDTIAKSNISTQEVLTGMNASAPSAPRHDNYTFSYWSRSYRNVKENIIVNAIYNEITPKEEANTQRPEESTPNENKPVVKTFNVLFYDGNTNELLKTETVSEGNNVSLPTPIEYKNYIFLGWFDKDNNSFTPSTKITTNTTITALYAEDLNDNGIDDNKEERFTVTFKTDDEAKLSLEGKLEFTNLLAGMPFKDLVTLPSISGQNGFEFTGWDPVIPELIEKNDVTYNATYKDTQEPKIQILDVNNFNPTSFKVVATDNDKMDRIDYSLYTNNNKIELGTWGEWIDTDEFERTQDFYKVSGEELLLSGLPDGEYTLRATARDLSGNLKNADSINFIVDKTAPIVKNITIDKSSAKAGDKIKINAEVTDAGVGVKVVSADFSFDENFKKRPDIKNIKMQHIGGNIYEIEYTVPENWESGLVYIRVAARDKCDNYSNNMDLMKSIAVDTINPETTIEVSEISAGKFTVSGVATDNFRLNRVFVQLVNRTTNKRCGGTTINLLNPNQKEAKWTVAYDVKNLKVTKSDESCANDGNYAAHVSVVDNFGNTGSAGWTKDFYVDITPPEKPTITSKDGYVAGTWVNYPVTLDFHSTDNITSPENLRYIYSTGSTVSLDKWKPIDNPKTFSKNKFNNVFVRAIDEAGNISEASNFFQVKVDVLNPTAPKVNLNGYIGRTPTNREITLEAYGSEEVNNTGTQISNQSPITYQYKLLDGEWTDGKKVVINSNYDGKVLFKVVDAATNESDITEVNVNFDKETIAVTKFLNNGKLIPVQDDFQGGRPRITVTAKAGMDIESGLKYVWTQSETQPLDEEINVSAKLETKDVINYVKYTRNIKDFVPNPNGVYYLWFRAEDLLGNYIYYRSNAFNFDNEAPARPTITSKDGYVAGTWVNYPVTLDFSSTDNVTSSENLRYIYSTGSTVSIDKWKPIDNPQTFSKNKFNNVFVRAIDEAGNISEASNFFQVKVDVLNPTAPKINLNGYNEGKPTNRKITLEAYGSEEVNNKGIQISNQSPITYQYKLLDGEWTDGKKVVINSNYNGKVLFKVVDEATNESDITEVNVNFDKETIAVTKFLNNGKSTPVQDAFQGGRPRITVTAKAGMDIESGLKYVWTQSETQPLDEEINVSAKLETKDGINYVKYTRNIKDFVPNPNGVYYLWFRAEDLLGNYIYYRSNAFNFDNEAPARPTITSKDGYVAGTWVNYPVTLDFSSTDNVTSPENLRYIYSTGSTVSIDKWKPIDNPQTFSKNKFNNVFVRAIDEAGNISEASNFFQVKVDVLNPTAPKVDVTTTEKSATLTASGSEEVNNTGTQISNQSPITYQYKIDDGNWINGKTVTLNAPINSVVTFRVIDEAGNISKEVANEVNLEDNFELSLSYLYYKNDIKEYSWTTGTSKDNPTETMTVRFRALSSKGVAQVRVLWTNEYTMVESATRLKKDLLANPYMDGTVELEISPDGYYRTTAPSNIEGRYQAGIVIIDVKGNVYAYPADTMYFKLPEEIKEPAIGYNVAYSTTRPTNQLLLVATVTFDEEQMRPSELDRYGWFPSKSCQVAGSTHYCKSWSKHYFDNKEETVKFKNKSEETANVEISIKNFDRILNDATITTQRQGENILVTLVADEEVIIKDSGWKTDDNFTWTKLFSIPKYSYPFAFSYADLAGNFKIRTIWIPGSKRNSLAEELSTLEDPQKDKLESLIEEPLIEESLIEEPLIEESLTEDVLIEVPLIEEPLTEDVLIEE